jgi:hypothetical protein
MSFRLPIQPAAAALLTLSLALPNLATRLPGQQPIVATVLSNGTTQSRYDMVILGDGYQAAEQTRFQQDVQRFLTALFQKQPYATFANYYNVHTVFRASTDSGASHPDATPPIVRNTAYGAQYNFGGTDRCLYITNTSRALADAALAPANEGRVLVFVNDSRYGGCASTFAVSYNGSSMDEVQIHELGHSLGGLADEYDYPNHTYTGGEPGEVNVTAAPNGQKWSHWWGTEGISAFEGARYHLFGLYRPRNHCLMRSLGQTLCAVCREQIAKTTNSVVNTIDSSTPAANQWTLNIGSTQTFAFTHFVPATHQPLVQWRFDGVTIAGANQTSYVLDTTGMSLGQHTLEASVRDQTSHVRNDPLGLMRRTRSWQITITDPQATNLRCSALASSQIWVQPGATVSLNTTLVNDGPATAPSFDVEFFLSENQQYSTQDIYLGRQTLTGFAPGQRQFPYSCQLPWRLEPRFYYVHLVIDRAGVLRETSRADNTRLTVVIGQTGPCVTRLEYTNPLVYPPDSATLSLNSGGTLSPTVIARCAAPGTLYLLVWGASGTAPGTPLTPSLTVPINQDFLTQLGLGAVNGSWFPGFLGQLDAGGMGRAHLVLPGNPGLTAMQTHFAGVLVDPVLGFSAVTNAIALQLQ